MQNENLRYWLFDNFLKVFLVVSAVLYWPGMMAYTPQEIFVQYCAVMFFALSLFVPRRREISNVFLGLILAYAVFHTLIMHFDTRPRLQVMNIFLGLMIVKILAERIDLDLSKIGKLYFWFAMLNVGLLALQYFNYDPIFMNVHFDKMSHVDQVGFMGSRFALGCMAAMMIPFLFQWSPWACVVTLPLLYFGKSSTAVAAAVFCFMFLIWFKNRHVFWWLVGFSVIGAFAYIVLLDYPSGQFMKRLKVWWFGLHMMRAHPWFGVGLGSWLTSNINTIQENGQPEQWTWAHNEYLQYLYEMGVFGIITIYAYYKNFIKKVNLNYITHRPIVAGAIALSVVAFFHFPFHVGRLAGIGMLIIALMEAHTSEVRNHEKII